MKNLVVLIVIGILLIVGYNYIDNQLEAYNNAQVTVIEAERCQQSVANGMPVEFCD